MYTKNKKYKIAAILGIIACSLTIITGFINFFAVAVIDTFFQLFDEMLAVVIDQSTGTTYYDLILQLGLTIIIAYLIGAIPTGYLIVKSKTGDDIRTIGSGSTGATNVKRVLGKKWNLQNRCVGF